LFWLSQRQPFKRFGKRSTKTTYEKPTTRHWCADGTRERQSRSPEQSLGEPDAARVAGGVLLAAARIATTAGITARALGDPGVLGTRAAD